jgi:integrase
VKRAFIEPGGVGEDNFITKLKGQMKNTSYTGLRIREVLGLNWSHVDLVEGKLSLTPLQTKTEAISGHQHRRYAQGYSAS